MRRQAGFTLIELVVVMALLSTGILAAGTVLASSTSFATASEARQAMAHRAQQEMERIGSLSYARVAHASLPTAAGATAADPLFYFDPSAGSYRWDRTAAGSGNAETMVSDAGGTVAVGPTAWSDGRLRGRLYAFVTWVTDGRCGSSCPTSRNYKRVTVALTLDAGGPAVKPMYTSSIVADPAAVPAGAVVNGNPNPLADPTINCRDAAGNSVSCTASVGSADVSQWYLTDSPATGAYTAPTASHPVHRTVAPVGTCTTQVTSGCPVPDLLGTAAPAATTPPPPLLNFSSDLVGDYPGGRLLKSDVACSATPSVADNARGQMWVTAPLSSAMSLTGSGGMTVTTQTAGGVEASATLCLGIYDAGGSIANMISTPPVRLGVVAYTMARWPTTPTPVSFSFDFLTSGTVTVAAGRRIAVRLWLASSATTDIAVLYDHPDHASVVQVNSL